MRTPKPIGTCEFCKKEKPIVAKGVCASCYQRKLKTGSFDYKRNGRNICSVDGCGKHVVSMGFCDTHRKQIERHGNLGSTRPSDWGARERHPLYGSWASFKRHRKASICSEWIEDFWAFVRDVGEKPGKGFLIMPKDYELPIGKNNFYWHEPVNGSTDEETKKIRAALVREDRKQNPEKYRNKDLIRYYGINLNEYNQMVRDQNNLCAICGKEETARDKHTGDTRNLAVDHCHETGKIRGLLCSSCNISLGGFKDNIELLKKAIDYLKKHKDLSP